MASSSAPDRSDPAPTIEDALLRHLDRRVRSQTLPIFAALGMLAAIAASHAGPAAALAWLALVGAVLLLRWLILRRLPSEENWPVSARVRIAVWLSAVNAAAHASSLSFFPSLPPFGRAIQSMLLACLASGSVATTLGYEPIFRVYVALVLLPLAALWAFDPVGNESTWVEPAVSLLIILYLFLLFGLGRDAWRSFCESFAIRLEHQEANRRLEQALGIAEEASRAKTRFLASASHDLRQPMHTVALFGAALSMQRLEPTARQIVGQMNTALAALAAQIDTLLDISRLDAGVVRIAPQEVDIPSILRRLVDDIAPVAIQRGLVLKLRASDAGAARIDPLHFERILRNLLDNALKYTDAGCITVEALRKGPEWILDVADTGRGIPEADLERVFEEFYQVENPERDRTQGLGLGLSIVRRLAALLHIQVLLTSRVGEGTRVRLTFAAVDRPSAIACAIPPPSACERLDGWQVLLVDDEDAVRSAMTALLSDLGCVVTSAGDIAGAVAKARGSTPDLVLADLRLRGAENGIDAIAAIRAVAPRAAALLVSGETSPERLREAYRAGFRILHKPVTSVAVLVDEMRQAFSEAGAHA
jgi:signal transduction histidine kinase